MGPPRKQRRKQAISFSVPCKAEGGWLLNRRHLHHGQRTTSLPKRPSDPPEIVTYLGLEQMTLQEISPECEYSRHLLHQLAAWCPTLKTELYQRLADQTLYVQKARVK